MHSSESNWRGGWGTLALFVACFTNTALPAQERTAHVLVLKDPTPREPDLEKRFKTSAASNAADPARIAAFNRQRFQLVSQASAHMCSLATVLEASVARHQEIASRSQQAQVAGAIETLAGNVYTAMVTSPAQPAARTAKASSAAIVNEGGTEQLTADARQLAVLTEALQTEVSKSGADTLAVGVLIRSAQVRDLAHSLKQRLQPEQIPHP